MRNNFQFVARIPYSITEPKRLVVASEVATMDFLRSHGLPIPKVYDYSATSENAAGTEYIFMELVHGKCLGDVWFDLSEKAMHTIIAKLVDLESRLFNITFPANGSLYYSKDLPVKSNHVEVPPTSSITSGRFCIGPDTTLGLWYGRRQNAGVDRGPCMHYPIRSDRFWTCLFHDHF